MEHFAEQNRSSKIQTRGSFRRRHAPEHHNARIQLRLRLRSTQRQRKQNSHRKPEANPRARHQGRRKNNKSQGAADLLLFHFPAQQIAHGESPEEALLKNYNGNIPFLLSAAIAPEDAQRIKKFSHPQCVGIELNEAFEIAPARKDIEKLRRFINEIRS